MNQYWFLAAVLLIGLIITLPQMQERVTIIGSDGLFHYNRFYDVAMQLKHHNFSYFIQLYGFTSSGRIVSAIYSPFVTYLLGGLLLACDSFYKFAIVTRFLFFVLASLSMNYALKMARIKNQLFIQVASTLYAFAPAVIGWGMGQNFSSIGAMLLPLVVGCGMRMINNFERPINWVQLGILMAVIIQTHLATAIQATVILVVYAIVALIVNHRKWLSLIKNGVAAIALCSVLSLNVIAGMIELYWDNIVIPIVTFDFKDGKGIYNLFQLNSGQWINLFFIMAVIIILIVLFKRLSLDLKVTGIFSLVLFLLATTIIVDWPTVMKSSAILNNTLQFPSRLKGPAVVMALMTITSVGDYQLTGKITKQFKVAVISMLSLFILVNMRSNRHYNQQSTRLVLASEKAIIPDVKRTSQLKKRISQIMREPLSSKSVNFITKSTPDYVPANYLPNRPVYYEYQSKIIEPSKNQSRHWGFDKSVRHHKIMVTWDGTGQYRNIPIVRYHNTRFKLNGHAIQPKMASGVIRIPRIKGIAGRNRLEVTYQPRLFSKLLLGSSIISWLILISYGLVYYVWLRFKKD